jgi:hypothetical protein
MAYNKTVIFQNIGKAIKKHDAIADSSSGFAAELDTILSEAITLLNDNAAERRMLNLFSAANRSDQASLEAMRRQAVSIISAYLTDGVREDLSVVGQTPTTVIDTLYDAMVAASDTVKENTTSSTTPTADADNAGSGSMSSVTNDQQCRDNNDFEIECIDATTEGSERWSVTSSHDGYVGEATTAVEFDASRANEDNNVEAGVKFTISEQAAISESGDDQNQLANWSFSGAIKGSNTDTAGKVYVKLSDSGGTRTVSVYKDSGKTQKVAEGSKAGDGEVTLAEQNSSGLSGTVDVTYTTDDSDIVLILPFAFAVGDKFTFSTSISASGNFQYFFVQQFGESLPSAASSSETVTESWAS